MNAEELLQWDRQRERWRRARQELHLSDTQDAEFATGGFGALVENLAVRLLILPADPQAHDVEFDENFVTWWTGDFPDPIRNVPMRWGASYRPGPFAAARYESVGEDRFWQYVAVRRDGGLDVGLGGDCRWDREKLRFFSLLMTVGRVWGACALHDMVSQRYPADGPWEVTLALRGTEGAMLGGFGEGWIEHGFAMRSIPAICLEPNLLLRREVETREEDWPRGTAFSFGAQIEDAFGSKHRRFKAAHGKFAGQFDAGNYSWG